VLNDARTVGAIENREAHPKDLLLLALAFQERPGRQDLCTQFLSVWSPACLSLQDPGKG
jgi:hypothetical protein